MISENFRALFYAPFYATIALGHFAREGVDVQLIDSSVPGSATNGLVDGSLDSVCAAREALERRRAEEARQQQLAALQYARMSLNHPPEMWKALQKRTEEVLPAAAERGEQALAAVKKRRWGNARNVLDSYVQLRDELGIEDLVKIEDAYGVEH